MSVGDFDTYPFDASRISNDELSAFARERRDLELKLLDEWSGNIDNFTDHYQDEDSPWLHADPVYLGHVAAQLGDRPMIDLGAGWGMPGYLREELSIDRYVAVDIDPRSPSDAEVGHPEAVQDEALHFLSQQPDGSANIMTSAFLRSMMFGSNWLDPGLDRLTETHGPGYAAAMAKLGEFVQRVLTEAHRVIPDDGRLIVTDCDYPDSLFAATGFQLDENLTIGVGTDPNAMDVPLADGLQLSLRSDAFEMRPIVRVYEKVPS